MAHLLLLDAIFAAKLDASILINIINI